MAKITYAAVVTHIHGKMGNMVFKERQGIDIVSSTPDQVNQPNSAAQLAQRQKFKDGAAYAKNMLADPTVGPLYVAKAKADKSSPMAEGMKDFFTPPVVDEIDVTNYHKHAGDTIAIRAHDDTAVESVLVTVKNAATQAVVESGPAVFNPTSGEWLYNAATDASAIAQVTVTAVAHDYPNHTGTLTVTAA